MMKDNKKIYTLKCKDISVCDIKMEDNKISEIIHIYNKKYAPVESYIFGDINLNRLNDWLSSRAMPIERDGFDTISSELNIKNNKEYLIDNLALSVSDQYWLKPYSMDINWKEINLFDNSFNAIEFSNATFGKDNSVSDSLNRIYLNTNYFVNHNATSEKVHYINHTFDNNYFEIRNFVTPNASLGGVLKKVWIQKECENYMLKGSNSIHNLEPINEVLASKIAKILELESVEYSLAKIQGKRTNQLVSVCKDIVDSSEHIVSAYSLVLGYLEAQIKDYPSYIELLENELNISNANVDIQKMLILDYIMLNEDRHLNNFGVIRDTDTLEWKRVCPVYDTGRSMNTAINEDYWDFENGEIKSFEGEMVNTDYLMNLIKLPVKRETLILLKGLKQWYGETLTEYQDILKLKDTTIQKITDGYAKRIDVFEKEMSDKQLIIDVEDELDDDIEAGLS